MNIKVIKTIKGKPPMAETNDYAFSDYANRGKKAIYVFPDIEYQEIKGFGGAFTEAASTTLYKLSKENREKILKLYFDKNDGIGYNFGRVHMNSCDFSLENYTCVEEGDHTLDTFNIKRDEKSIIPMIKGAMEYNDVEILVSPWSPPAYMKTNGQMNEGGKLKEEYFELWAEYYVKFIEKYREQGINITAITVQNEPGTAQKWDSCVYTAEEERDFVVNYLGKKMDNIGVKILFWDHNKENVVKRAKTVLSNENSKKYFSGIAVHWYRGDHFEQLEMFNKMFPDKDIVLSEGCYEYSLGSLDITKIGEKYAHDMIGNFNNYCNIFCDWNLILDEKGGPNHVGNFCDAPIMADTKNNKVYIHDSYYYIGHISKYVKKGAKRIGSSKWTKDVDTVSFKNPDGSIVTVVLNMTNADLDYAICMGEKVIKVKAEARSITTYIFS